VDRSGSQGQAFRTSCNAPARGALQVIGSQEPCVVISMAGYKRLTHQVDEPHMGKWLIENLRGLGEIELPSRHEDRPSPFADWEDEV